MSREVQPEKLHAAGGWHEQPRQHFDGGGFAGAIGTQKAEELSRGHLKVDAINGGEGPKAPSKFVRRDGNVRHGISFGNGGNKRWKTLA
jgi:hypothetical protein